MAQFELFCAVFYALDAVWEKTGGEQFRKSGFEDDTVQNEDLRQFLSDANPFLWRHKPQQTPQCYLYCPAGRNPFRGQLQHCRRINQRSSVLLCFWSPRVFQYNNS